MRDDEPRPHHALDSVQHHGDLDLSEGDTAKKNGHASLSSRVCVPKVYISSPALRPLRTAPASRAQCDLEDMHHISSLTHAHRTPTL